MGGIVESIVPIIGAIGGLFSSKSSSPSAPAAPTAPDTSAVDQKARATEERQRQLAARQNETNPTGGSGLAGQATTKTSPLG